jgi:hypothetical protein
LYSGNSLGLSQNFARLFIGMSHVPTYVYG